MTALTADAARRTRNRGNKDTFSAPVATSSTIYVGSHCVFAANGRVRALQAATVNVYYAGMSETQVTGNAGGTVYATLSSGYEVLCNTGSDLAGEVRQNAALQDDDTVTFLSDAGSAGLQIVVGAITERVSATTAWVALHKFTSET